MKKNVAEFRKKTGNIGQTTSEGGSCDETTAKKGHYFVEGDDKKGRQFSFRKKIGDTVSCRRVRHITLVTPQLLIERELGYRIADITALCCAMRLIAVESGHLFLRHSFSNISENITVSHTLSKT